LLFAVFDGALVFAARAGAFAAFFAAAVAGRAKRRPVRRRLRRIASRSSRVVMSVIAAPLRSDAAGPAGASILPADAGLKRALPQPHIGVYAISVSRAT